MVRIALRRVGDLTGAAGVVPVGTLKGLRVYARATLKLRSTPSKVFSSTGDEILAQNYEQLRGEFTDGDVVYVSCGEPWRTPGQPRMRDKACSYFTRVSLFSIAFVFAAILCGAVGLTWAEGVHRLKAYTGSAISYIGSDGFNRDDLMRRLDLRLDEWDLRLSQTWHEQARARARPPPAACAPHAHACAE